MEFVLGVWAELRVCTCRFKRPFASAGAALGRRLHLAAHATSPGFPSTAWRGETARNEHQPTFVLDFKQPLLPEAPEWGDAGAGADEDAGHLRILGQVEPGCSARIKDTDLTQAGCSLPRLCPQQAEKPPGEGW